MAVLKCPLSVLERCPSYREFSFSKMTKKRPGKTQDVRLIEVSVGRVDRTHRGHVAGTCNGEM